jgi:hypothetical protein
MPHDGTDVGARCLIIDSVWREKISGRDPKMSEWNALKDRFDVQAHDECDGVEKIFDDQFRRRFTEVINRVAERNSKTGYVDWSRR